MNLYFSSVPSPSGFTTATLSSTNDKEASKIIKEIIQNSYDSALEKGVDAKIEFIHEKMPLNEIPYLSEYKKALKLIEKETLSEQEKDILNEIKAYLAKEEIDVLYVKDNGTGFNTKNMVAMLGDGISVKQEGSGGSYGNGHFSIFNTSFLRYLLYFGKNNEGEIFSGHTILRTFEENGELKDKNGYILKEQKPLLKNNDIFIKKVPALFRDKIKNMDTGAVIAVLGFNFFLNSDNWADLIKASVVRNFFVAIERGRLEVKITEGKKTHTINSCNFDILFEETKDIKIRPRYEEIKTFLNLLAKPKYLCMTQCGEVEIYLSQGDETKLAISRNGMYITSKLPSPLRKIDFLGYKPFNALIIPESMEISNLIKNAEGPLHDDLSFRRFSGDKTGKEKKKKLREVFKEINLFIKSKTKKVEEESLSVEIPELNVVMLSGKHDKKGKKRTNKISKKRNKAVIGSDEKIEKQEIRPQKASSKNKLRVGKEILLKKFLAFNDTKSNKLYLKFESEYKDVFLRLKTDDGTDETCDIKSAGTDIEIENIEGENAEIKGKFILVTDIKNEVNLTITYKSEYKDSVINYQFFKAIV